MFQSISGAPRVVEARRELEEAVDKLLLQNSGTNATSKNDETINNRTVTSKTTKKSATVSNNNNSDKTRSGPVESTRAFKSVKENLSNFHSSLLIAVESAALELQSKANHTNNNNNSAAKGRTLNLDGGEEADANALATHTTTTDTTNDNINATAVSQEEIDLHTGGMVLPPSIRPSQQKAQKMPPDTIKKRTVSKKATSRSASSANKEKKTTTSGLGKEGGKTKNNNTTSEVRPTQSAPERTTGASPTSNQNSALSKLLLTLFYVQECNQCMAKLMKKGLYREAKLLFTEATTADISTLREISELLVEADYFTLPGKKVQPSSTENENDGKTKKKKSMSVASSKVSRGGNTPAPVAEDTTPDNNDAEPIDHEEKMWERMRMKTTNVVQEPITSASDLPLALWAHTLLVEHDNNRDVCLFQEAIQQDRFADVYTKIAVSEEEKKNNLNSDALAGRIEAMFQRICKTIAAPRFKASSTLHKIHAPHDG
ncbi:hypothetical protein ADEAN_000789800 [Angomonas deanei]|uniref:Uncharacterized protein n=1 Tax=Angomonas deanei TaxID=59799 RepID=A0A7G2CKG2_9TRYP|nr:hypothetical protein ADEAN_000789800 [Angomonas deanei]